MYTDLICFKWEMYLNPNQKVNENVTDSHSMCCG